jgi:hypothetical protein
VFGLAKKYKKIKKEKKKTKLNSYILFSSEEKFDILVACTFSKQLY